MNNLVVAVLGHRNSGKSSTWNRIFDRRVKTGIYERRMYFNDTEYVNIFLVSGSPEERELYVGDIIQDNSPRIVLCSMQYRQDVTETINYFTNNHYLIYCQWLNPGYSDPDVIAFDSLGLAQYLLGKNSIVSIRNGKNYIDDRANEIKDFIYGWAFSRGLICTDN